MEKKELSNILSAVLLPLGFNKKGNHWLNNGTEVTKMVNLQKSQFGNSFYINFGYILKAIPLGANVMHIHRRIASTDKRENQRIDELLDLDNSISVDVRTNELKATLSEKLIEQLNSINTENDILEMLQKQPHLNNVPLVVKRHFNLPE